MPLLRLLALIFIAAALRAEPASIAPLPRSTPEAEGLSSAALQSLYEEAGRRIDAFHSLMIVRHGRVVAEGWWAPYRASAPHIFNSLSKSFTATAVGLAVAEGRLSIDDPVLKFFPDRAPAEPSENLKAMRVRDLLRMTTGHTAEAVRGFPFASSEDLVRRFLALPVADRPGTHFVYNTAGSFMLSAIVQQVTGQNLADYLRPRLFEPLGIADPVWESTATGLAMGGFGLSATTEDIAKFGQLYLQRGEWQGRRLLPAAWVDESTTLQTSTGSDPTREHEQGYGYQFWRCSQPGFYRGDGNFGQYCIVMPQYDTVLAVTAGAADMNGLMRFLYERLLPELRPTALPADPVAVQRLQSTLAALALPTPTAVEPDPRAAAAIGRRYVFPENSDKIETLSLERADTGLALCLRIAGQDYRVRCGDGAWLDTDQLPLAPRPGFAMSVPRYRPVAVSGAWTAADTYTARVCLRHTPYVVTLALRFAGDTVACDQHINVYPDSPQESPLVGRVQ
jgi:CubicO group peptidase (beta-lactamase class C family)